MTPPTPPNEADAVRAAFAGYKQAILDQDGVTALGWVDAKTLAYYGRMRELALHAERDAVARLSTMDKLMVFTVRHRIVREAVEAMDGAGLFVHAVEQGWIGKRSVVGNEIGEVAIAGTTATGTHVTGGRTSGLKWVFTKEGGRWKIDLTSNMALGDQALKAAIGMSGMGEDEFLFSMLESVSGRKVESGVWEPMARE